MTYSALSVVSPAGSNIASGEKTLEIRDWRPDTLPLKDLVIVENEIRLSRSGTSEDPNGKAVALVDVEAVRDWQEHDLAAACANYWEPDWLAWEISNVRPITEVVTVPAKLRVYQIDLPKSLPC